MAAEVIDHMTSHPKETHYHFSTHRVFSDYSVIDKDVSSFETFERVVTTVKTQNSQVLNPPLLEKLYLFFIYLSDISRNCSSSRSSDYVGIKIQKFNYTLKFSDILNISSFLFGELSRRFKLCSVDEALAQSNLHSESWGTLEELILLLRCCMAMLHLLEAEPSVLLEKCQDLLTIARKLCSPDLSCEHPKPLVLNRCSILEVFVDELLVHRQLRQYFITVDDVSFTNEKLFKHPLGDGYNDHDAVLEVVSAHFILLWRDEHVRKEFIDTSVSSHSKKASCPELSLTAAMMLLGTPVMVSAPVIFQTYLISMISRCIGVDRTSDDLEIDTILKNFYISAFERSCILYIKQISSLEFQENPRSANSGSTSLDKTLISGKGRFPSFESYIRPVTQNRINLIADVSDYCSKISFKSKSEFLTASNAYIKENEQMLNMFYKDDILSVLNAVVSQTIFAKVEGIDLDTSRDVNQQDTYLLASILNLMSNSMLQIIRCMHGGSFGFQKTLTNHFSCEEYDAIIRIIGGLLQCCDDKSTLKNLQLMESNLTNHKESKLMIMHFAGFLPFCYSRGHEHLWKGCILIMMTLVNLIIFEDGNLEELKILLSCRKKYLSSRSATEPSKVSDSSIIASRFQRFQERQLRRGDSSSSNGKSYLKLLNVEQSDIDDLADFVDCSEGKDRRKWLKDRQKFRGWTNDKMAIRKRNKRSNFLKPGVKKCCV